MQAVRIQGIRHVVAGHDEDQAMLEERVQQALQDHCIGDVRDVELVEADDGVALGSAAGHLVERVGHGLEGAQLLVHGPHEFVEMQAGLAGRGQGLEEAVHQEALAASHAAIHPDAARRYLAARHQPLQQAAGAVVEVGQLVGQLLQSFDGGPLGRVGGVAALGQPGFVAIDDVGHGVTSRWHLHVECAFLDCERCLTHRLGHRRVRVADAGDVLGRGLELHGDHGFGD